ncbi:trypsin-7-like isoform X2 [Cloeon dipterum]|uniref:trypsin-7-like isoform X2 n=1 Tax=Cloeon dipterum TaxID=197152 RepID=UPI00321FC3A5
MPKLSLPPQKPSSHATSRAHMFSIFGSVAWLLRLIYYDYAPMPQNSTQLGDFPSQVSIHFLGVHSCGATIIGEQWILTAAHCIDVLLPSVVLKVRANSNSLTDSNGTMHSVVRVRRHPGFVLQDLTSEDIGLVQVNPPFVFGATAQAALLPEQDEELAADEDATTAGWGFLEKGLMSPLLIRGQQQVGSREECFEIFHPEVTLTEAQFCAESLEEANRICTGDSGGPLFVGGKVVGIVSWSANECEDDYPSVYTRVSSFRDWIRDNTGI